MHYAFFELDMKHVGFAKALAALCAIGAHGLTIHRAGPVVLARTSGLSASAAVTSGPPAPAGLRAAVVAEEADLVAAHYLETSEARLAVNLTCLRPEDEEAVDSESGSYEKFNDELLALDLRPGRLCSGGKCNEACCSRVFLRRFATADECADLRSFAEQMMPPPAPLELRHDVYLRDAAAAAAAGTSPSEFYPLFIRLVERMRRALAREYGLPLKRLRPRLSFVSRVCAPDEGGLWDVGELHADECSDSSYHYSGILYLNAGRGDAFEGGELCFVDDGGERRLLAPTAGLAAIFSSGWENLHHIAPVRSGTRFAVPMFFTTQPAPAGAAAGAAVGAAVGAPEMGVALGAMVGAAVGGDSGAASTSTPEERAETLLRLADEGPYEELVLRWAELFDW